MARGWESKAVESQQADAAATPSRQGPRAPEDRAREERRRGLVLARARVAAELTAAVQPAHRQMLEGALTALDAELARLA